MLDDNDNTTSVVLGIVAAIVLALLVGTITLARNTSEAFFKGELLSPSGLASTSASASTSARAEASGAPSPSSEKPMVLGTLGFVVSNGKITLSGIVPDSTRQMRLVNQAALLFGQANVINEIRIDPTVEARRWKGNSLDLMTRLKTFGDVGLALYGKADTINFKGTVASDAAQAEVMTWLQTFFKDGVKINVDIKIDAKLATEKAANPAVLLNESIEFASGRADIPQNARSRLQLIADVIREDGRRVTVVGHTDSQGDAAANRTLSMARAEAVKAFLIEHGVSAANLNAAGMGQDQPLADNATPTGRQKNRRIEFLN
jgi:OmpA-OmpF porin, OOP family